MNHEELELTILKNVEEMHSQKSLASEIGFSVGKVNYVLKALVDKGFVKADVFLNSQNKRKYTYLLTDEGIKEKMTLTKKFIVRKKAEYEELQSELEADKVKWGGAS
ncbi:MarR family EPS-associated transcriptional regulator [Sulfurimonas aquatica]|uniref:MarR family EPS-associated transcriptional regulator n=1 Tax=Sulfurimonas aquatica TaxID=2672570 RepID=A0A975GD94_9BACT|nr:MarR family EPS-associated transcriptional regulator [Sulfurimonas aquatica]QSZ42352.1 MarR family EPS-associated transcriptional regulator [Sulfurimonas aquatica]